MGEHVLCYNCKYRMCEREGGCNHMTIKTCPLLFYNDGYIGNSKRCIRAIKRVLLERTDGEEIVEILKSNLEGKIFQEALSDE